MSSIKDRQRAAARARLEKEMAERAAAAKKRRQRRAVVGAAVAVVVIAGAAVFVVMKLQANDRKHKADALAATQASCTWIPSDASSGAKVVDVGTPPVKVSKVGTDKLTITTNLGALTATVDKSKAPCTAAAFTYLASKKFWDGTKCHRLTTAGIEVLQCGDPTAKGKGYRQTDGTGGPSFRYAEENLPTGQDPTYPAGTIAMAKTSEASSTGSQFFMVYKDIPAASLPAEYTVLGKLDAAGLAIVQKAAKGGTDNANGQGDGHPKTEVDIKSLTMTAA